MTEQIKSKLISRKFWVGISVMVLATAMQVTGQLDADQWVDLMKWVGGTYIVGQGIADGFKR